MKKVRKIERCGRGKNEWTRQEREKNKKELKKVFGL
jgi:hypothetical protein